MQREILPEHGMQEFRAIKVERVMGIGGAYLDGEEKQYGTVKQRIVDYLSRYSARVYEAYAYSTLPWEVCQEGIAEGIGVTRPHAALRLRDLIDEDVVSERLAHVEGFRRKRKVYYLNEVMKHGE